MENMKSSAFENRDTITVSISEFIDFVKASCTLELVQKIYKTTETYELSRSLGHIFGSEKDESGA